MKYLTSETSGHQPLWIYLLSSHACDKVEATIAVAAIDAVEGVSLTSAIGLRVYQITISLRGDSKALAIDDPSLRKAVKPFLTGFVGARKKVIRNATIERSWYFEEKSADGSGKSRGYVHYGTFGFTSRMVDTVTQKTNYRRKVTDIEEVPLYYEFWCPDKGKHALIAFQSFQ